MSTGKINMNLPKMDEHANLFSGNSSSKPLFGLVYVYLPDYWKVDCNYIYTYTYVYMSTIMCNIVTVYKYIYIYIYHVKMEMNIISGLDITWV